MHSFKKKIAAVGAVAGLAIAGSLALGHSAQAATPINPTSSYGLFPTYESILGNLKYDCSTITMNLMLGGAVGPALAYNNLCGFVAGIGVGFGGGMLTH